MKELFTALSKAQGEIEDAQKNGDNPHFGNAFSTMADIKAVIKGPLAKHGLCVVQSTESFGNQESPTMVLKTTIGHMSGESITGTYKLMPVKNDPQGMGSCITYAKRYALSAMLNIASDEDDDGNAASQPGKPSTTAINPPGGAVADKDPGAFKVPFGNDKGKAIRELSPQSIDSNIKYWQGQEAIKSVTGTPKAFLVNLIAFKASKTATTFEQDDLHL